MRILHVPLFFVLAAFASLGIHHSAGVIGASALFDASAHEFAHARAGAEGSLPSAQRGLLLCISPSLAPSCWPPGSPASFYFGRGP
eukprot:121679-Pleurochrysis_carterae.AAC.1